MIVSKSPLAALSLADTRSRRVPKPPPPLGPRGCLTTLLPGASSRIPFDDKLAGRLGTGGIEELELLKALLLNIEPNPPGLRRMGEANVA